MPDAHAAFSPSSAARWLACPYSVPPPGMEIPDSQNMASAGGTAMHDRAEQHLTKETDPAADSHPVTFELDGINSLSPLDWQAHVVPYVRAVRELRDEAMLLYGEARVEFLVEQEVSIIDELCWGTLDAGVVVPGVVAHIADLKTGRHAVSPESEQFKTYAVGVCEKYGYDFPEGVYLHRSQTRAADWGGEAWATVKVTTKDLKEHKARVVQAIKVWKAGGEPSPVNMNPECCWCPFHPDKAIKNGLAPCRAYETQAKDALKAAGARIDEAGKVAFAKPADVRIDNARLLLATMPSLVNWWKKFKAYWDKKAIDEGAPLGFELQPKRTSRVWRQDMSVDDIAAQLEDLADVLGVDLSPIRPAEKALITITEAEKLLGKEVLADLTEKPEGAPVLVQEGHVSDELYDRLADWTQ